MSGLALTPEERQRLYARGVLREPDVTRVGRPKRVRMSDPPVCRARGCFNFVSGDGPYCAACNERSAFKPRS